MTILFDSGIRTGPDVFKAIALGAHAVMVGRLYVWGMSHEAEAGCRHVMKSLLAVRLVLSWDNVAHNSLPLGSGYHNDGGWVP